MNVVIYIRWSSAEQAKGSTLERQRDDCLRHAAAKGWNVVAVIVDDGVSAFKGRQSSSAGALGRFVADVEAGAYAEGVILLTEKLDRLSRQKAKQVFSWMVRVTDLGVVIATVEGDRRYDSGNLDMAMIIEIIVKAQLANEESEKKATRIAAAWASKRNRLARGEKTVLTRRAPAWLRVEGTPPVFVVIPERAAIVRRVFEDTVAGFGKNHIARNLNLESIATFGRADGWHASYVQKILKSAAVLGEFQPGRKPRGEARTTAGDVVADYYPRIVDADLHANAMTSMAGRGRQVAGRGRRLSNLFAGLATCASCRAKMTFRAKGRKERADGTVVHEDYLVCDGYQRGLGCTAGQHFNYAEWRDGILSAILHAAMNDRHFASPEVVRPLEVELATLTRTRDATRARAETAMALHLETGREEPKTRWLELVAEADEHDRIIGEMKSKLVAARGTVSPEEHRRRIGALHDAIDDADEAVRFMARSRVMQALQELVASMAFSTAPLHVMLYTKDGITVRICENDRGDGTGLASEAWTTDPDARWPGRYEPPDHVQPDHVPPDD